MNDSATSERKTTATDQSEEFLPLLSTDARRFLDGMIGSDTYLKAAREKATVLAEVDVDSRTRPRAIVAGAVLGLLALLGYVALAIAALASGDTTIAVASAVTGAAAGVAGLWLFSAGKGRARRLTTIRRLAERRLG